MWDQNRIKFCYKYEKLIKRDPKICKNIISQSIHNENMLEKKQWPLRLDCYIKLLIYIKSQSKWNQQVYCQHKTSKHIHCYKMHIINFLKLNTKICQKYCKVCWRIFTWYEVWLNGLWLYQRLRWKLVVC